MSDDTRITVTGALDLDALILAEQTRGLTVNEKHALLAEVVTLRELAKDLGRLLPRAESAEAEVVALRARVAELERELTMARDTGEGWRVHEAAIEAAPPADPSLFRMAGGVFQTNPTPHDYTYRGKVVSTDEAMRIKQRIEDEGLTAPPAAEPGKE